MYFIGYIFCPSHITRKPKSTRRSRATFLQLPSMSFWEFDGWKKRKRDVDHHARPVNGYRIIQPEVRFWRPEK